MNVGKTLIGVEGDMAKTFAGLTADVPDAIKAFSVLSVTGAQDLQDLAKKGPVGFTLAIAKMVKNLGPLNEKLIKGLAPRLKDLGLDDSLISGIIGKPDEVIKALSDLKRVGATAKGTVKGMLDIKKGQFGMQVDQLTTTATNILEVFQQSKAFKALTPILKDLNVFMGRLFVRFERASAPGGAFDILGTAIGSK
jgi:hypothetical protein